MIDMVGFEGIYKITEDGRVYSLPKPCTGAIKGMKKGKFLNVFTGSGGYQYVRLANNGEHSNALLHRLVAQNFIENTDGKPCVNHKDGDKKNNHVSNLEWVTYSENMIHAAEHGLINPKKALNYNQMEKIRLLYSTGKYTHNVLAEMFGCGKSTIQRVVTIYDPDYEC